MTPADVMDLLARVWPGVVLAAPAVPATWWIAKLYYDREIRILQQRLETEKREADRLRTLKDSAPSRELSPAMKRLSAASDLGTSARAPLVPWPRVGQQHTAEENIRLQRRTQELLRALDHILQQYDAAMNATKATARERFLSPGSAAVAASHSYNNIRKQVVDARDRLLAQTKPSALVARAPNADAAYESQVDRSSLAMIHADLTLLARGLPVDDIDFL